MLWPPHSSSPRASTTPPPSSLSLISPRQGSSDPWFARRVISILSLSLVIFYTLDPIANIRVWKNRTEFSGFNPDNGLMKAIVISGERIYTGYQDGKIHIWKVLSKDLTMYKGVGTLPRLKDFLKSSINPSNYVKVRRHATPSCFSVSTSCPASALTRKRVSSTPARGTRLWKCGETQTPIGSNRWVPTMTRVIQWSSDSMGLFSSCPQIVRSKCRGGSQQEEWRYEARAG